MLAHITHAFHGIVPCKSVVCAVCLVACFSVRRTGMYVKRDCLCCDTYIYSTYYILNTLAIRTLAFEPCPPCCAPVM